MGEKCLIRGSWAGRRRSRIAGREGANGIRVWESESQGRRWWRERRSSNREPSRSTRKGDFRSCSSISRFGVLFLLGTLEHFWRPAKNSLIWRPFVSKSAVSDFEDCGLQNPRGRLVPNRSVRIGTGAEPPHPRAPAARCELRQLAFRQTPAVRLNQERNLSHTLPKSR